MDYGKELILDIHSCDTSLFTRERIYVFMVKLCELINMERCEFHIWDDLDLPENERQTSAQTKGTSAVQFIITSNITIHTLDLLGNVYLNIFSCKNFDELNAAEFCEKFWAGKIVSLFTIYRK